MRRWTLEQIEAQACKGGVNRQQVEQLTAHIRLLEQQVAALQAHQRGDDPLNVFRGEA